VLPNLVVSQIEYRGLLEQDGRTPLRIKRGEAVLMVPGLRHRATMVGWQPGYSHWSHTQCEVLQGVSLFYLIDPPPVIRGPRAERIAVINQELGAVASAELTLPSLLRRQALGWELVTTILENVRFTADRIDLVRNATRLTPVLAYIEENLARPISHDLLARTAGLSPSRFHVLFRAALGSAPYEYVQKLRLEKAQQLLVRTDRSVGEIGQAVGHPDPYHFSRVFRRQVGVSPAAYRKQAMVRSL
jgi:AraC-like DNA-binding protein